MTRDEIRQMAEWINTTLCKEHPSIEPVIVPSPEPAYWDNFPHLTNACEDDDTVWAWRVFLQGEREQKVCEGCEQLVWEYDDVWQALIYIDELEYIVDNLTLCLPCFKAIGALPNTIVDYVYSYYAYLSFDISEVVPSEGVFTDEYWYRKAKLNYSPEDVHAIKSGTLTARDIMERRVEQWSRY